MSGSKVIVQRRFPTYDFVMFVSLPPRETSDQMDEFLRRQERPRGFVLTDPRVDGIVGGSTFSFRRRTSGFGGSIAPYVEGYFVPEGEGTNIFVRVRVPTFWWVFNLLFIGLLLTSYVPSASREALLTVPFVLVTMAALTCGPLWYEASRARVLLHELYARPRLLKVPS